jgi:hypothetical protein
MRPLVAACRVTSLFPSMQAAMPANDAPARRDIGATLKQSAGERDDFPRTGEDDHVDDAKRRNAQRERRRQRRRVLIVSLIGVVLLVAAGGYGWHWYKVGRFMIETDDAYTQADNVAISPQVAGYVFYVMGGVLLLSVLAVFFMCKPVGSSAAAHGDFR